MSVLSDNINKLRRDREGTSTALTEIEINIPPISPIEEGEKGPLEKANELVGDFADRGEGLLRGAGRFGVDVARAIPRAGGQLSLQVQKTIRGVDEEIYIPRTPFEQLIFGKEPIRDIDSTGRELLEDVGVREEQAKLLGPFVGVGLFALDIFPGIPGKKKIAKTLILKVARKYGDDTAKEIVKLGDTKLAEASLKKGGGDALRKAGIDVIDPKLPVDEFAKQVKKKIVSQKFGTDKFNAPPGVIKGLEQYLNAMGFGQRTVRTIAEMAEASKLLGMDPEKLIKEVASNRIIDKEVIALGQIIKDNADRIVNLEKRIIKNPDAEEILRPKIAQLSKQINEAMIKRLKGGTEAGRAIVAFRKMADSTLDTEFWLRQAAKQTGGILDESIQSAIFALIKDKDRNGLAALVAGLRVPNNREKLITLWKAGLLTNITTHLANLTGNTTMVALMTASDVVALPFDVLMALKTGKRTVIVTPGTIVAKFKINKAALKESKEFLRTGVYSENLLKKWDIPRNVKFENKLLNGYTNAVFRSLGAEDIFFRKIAISESMEKSATLIAKNEGLTGLTAKTRIKELLIKPTMEMTSEAIDAGEFATFTNRNAVSDAIVGWKRALESNIQRAKVEGRSAVGSQITLGVTDFIAPFTRTPTNIAGRIIDFSPIGFVKAAFKAARPTTRSQKEFARDMGRATTGTGFVALGAYLANKGLVTGNAPTNSAERQQFYAQGKQPNSIRIGDQWLRLNRTSPLGNLLTMGASFQELSIDKDGVDLVASSLGEAAKGLTEQTFLKGVSNSLKAINDPERNSEGFVAQAIASTIPSIIGSVARTIDPTMRVPDSILDTVKTRIPFLSKTVAERRDIFGNVVKVPGGKGVAIDPFARTTAVKDPVIEEAKSLDIAIGLPNQTVDGIKMTEHEFALYQKVQGKMLHAYLSKLLENEQYKKMDDINKEVEFKSVIREVRSQVNDIWFPAIMMQRFDLPEDTNPLILREILKQANKVDAFDRASDEKKSRIIRRFTDQIELSSL